MLTRRNMRGTFYVPITPFRGRPPIENSELRELLGRGCEIGAHGFSHKLLWRLSPKELAQEVDSCRPIMEDILGAKVEMFCYPQGRYDSATLCALQRCGYLGARTVRMFSISRGFDPFRTPTTLQAFPHVATTYLKNILRGRKLDSMRLLLAQRGKTANWVTLAKSLFDSVLQDGGVWHLYGHSWEVQELGLWKELGDVLEYVSNRPGVQYVTNAQLIRNCA